MEAGLDSMSLIDLRASLEGAFAIDLPATVILDHPTIAALIKHINSMSKVSIVISLVDCHFTWFVHHTYTTVDTSSSRCSLTKNTCSCL